MSAILGNTAPGSGAPIVNAGDVENSGVEFQIGYRTDLSENLSFDINYNFTTLDNEVLKVDNSDGYIAGGELRNWTV